MSGNQSFRLCARPGRSTPDVAIDCEPVPGAHLVTQRPGYEHHGIYVGNGRVVHYAGFGRSMHRGPIEETTLERFAAGREVRVRVHPTAMFTGQDAVRRVRSRLGEDHYRLLSNNCEHLCAWALFGENRSSQVEACLSHPGLACRVAIAMLKGWIEARGRGGLLAA
ncbi:Lecithin retinol acyltransferase [Burkholderia sp. D7]|nr:Lecithin retinol acyltransferase [Burkholderia sp. D7]